MKQYIFIEVEDHGQGIAEDEQVYIFEKTIGEKQQRNKRIMVRDWTGNMPQIVRKNTCRIKG